VNKDEYLNIYLASQLFTRTVPSLVRLSRMCNKHFENHNYIFTRFPETL